MAGYVDSLIGYIDILYILWEVRLLVLR